MANASKPSAVDRDRSLRGAVRGDVRARQNEWGAYFRNLVKDSICRDATGQRIFLTPTQVAEEIGVAPPNVRKWFKGKAYPDRQSMYLVAVWAQRPLSEIYKAAGIVYAGSYADIAVLMDAVRAAPETGPRGWSPEKKAEVLTNLELVSNPGFLVSKEFFGYPQLVDAALQQRIPDLAKAERINAIMRAYFATQAEDAARRETAQTENDGLFASADDALET